MQGQWWRLITAIFIHFGTLHLVFNCLWLAQLGPALEGLLGRSRFAVLYVLTGAGGFAMSIAYRLISGTIVGIGGGASGAVFGLIGAALTLTYIRKVPGSSFFSEGLLKWALFGLVMSLLPGIDLAAHIGGALIGFGMALAMGTADRRARHLSKGLWLLTEIGCLLVLGFAFALAMLYPSPTLIGQ